MPNGIYKTAQGKMLNIENLRLANEKEKAVGNMQVNARGDKVSSDGSIIQSKQDQLKERHRKMKNFVTYNPKRKG